MILKPQKGILLNRSHNLAKGLVGCWLINEGGGNMLFDLSGNGNTGTIQNTPCWTGGKFGPAIESELAVKNGFLVPNSESLVSAVGAGQPRTWMYQIKTTILADNRLISDKASFLGQQLWSEKQVTGANYSIDGGVTVAGAVTTGAILVIDVSYQIIFTYDGTHTRLYLDGVLIDGPNAQTAAADAGNAIQVMYYSGSVVPAIMDYFYLYNRCFSASEVSQIYREPFIMFKRESTELWAAAQGTAAPGAPGAMTLNTGYWGPTI